MSDLSEISDADLLKRHAMGGDKAAFGELFRRHRQRLWAVALRTLSDPEEAADALQDAMIKAYRAASRFRGDSAVTTWLHRIVVNACLDRVRRKQARPTVPLAEEWDPPAASTDRADVLAVRAALAQLPVEQRAVLVYIDMLGYSVSEVAEIMEVAVGTVKSRASRSRSQLASILREQGNQPPTSDVSQVMPRNRNGDEEPQAPGGKEDRGD